MSISPSNTAAPPRVRLPALDWMRGFVMVLMTIDHASGAFNAGRLMTDSAFMYKPGMPLPEGQFFTRWITHLCAPSFVFLAGTALALSVEKRRAAGESARSLDRFILTRGLLIAALDVIWMSFMFLSPGRVLLQVLYAIGIGLVCMVPLRRLGDAWLLGAGLLLAFGGEALVGLAMWAYGGPPGGAAALLLSGGPSLAGLVAYPLVPWLAMMMLGWSFGRFLRTAKPGKAERVLAGAGGVALGIFAVVRGLNGYGNMRLSREGGSIVQWLHVSKYPPSLSYTALELGIMALCLAALLALDRRLASVEQPRDAPLWTQPLLIFGQTAFFFYLLHAHILKLAAWALGMGNKAGLAATYISALGALIVLYPLCAWYRGYKRAHPDGWTRYL